MRSLLIVSGFIFSLFTLQAQANENKTHRTPQFSNEEVSVWTTVVYPNKDQKLKMHRHDYNRVVVALDSGVLKIRTNQGKEHLLHVQKDHAYYFTKDVPGELHTDENMSKHPMKAIVIELKK